MRKNKPTNPITLFKCFNETHLKKCTESTYLQPVHLYDTNWYFKKRIARDPDTVQVILTSAVLPVLGPSLSKTLGLRDVLSDMVFVFSTVTFLLIFDILYYFNKK